LTNHSRERSVILDCDWPIHLGWILMQTPALWHRALIG